jgi:hypothetical protein
MTGSRACVWPEPRLIRPPMRRCLPVREKRIEESHNDSGTPVGIAVEPPFVLLFSIYLRATFAEPFSGIAPLPPEQSGEYVARLAEFDTRLLGKMFREAGLGGARLDRRHQPRVRSNPPAATRQD